MPPHFSRLPLSVLIGRKRLVFLGGLLLFATAAYILGPRVITLTGASSPFAALIDFFSGAFQPTLSDQNPNLPEGTTPFFLRLLGDLLRTLRYALIAMSIAVPAGALLGFLASNAWWPEGRHPAKLLLKPCYFAARFSIALMRSIHELIWVMFFLSAIGDDPLTACVAIAIPFAGTLAKVFSELIDEQGRSARTAFTATGATPLKAFLASLLPQALPDLTTYTLYRFECAVRSAAVLGFIGVETIGFTIRRSFENLYWNEVWTGLYALIVTVVVIEIIGAKLRHRLNTAAERKAIPQKETLASLRKTRPVWHLLRTVNTLALVAAITAWFVGDPLLSERIGSSRADRLERFFTKLTPDPVEASGNWADALPWAAEIWQSPGREALVNTLAIASAAISLAAFLALLIVPWATRAIATAQPLNLTGGHASRISRFVWKIVGGLTRWIFVMARAVPEYIIAYLLIGLLGPGAWPLVIALALHNLGIFGRLWNEVLENQSPAAARQLMQTGGSRPAAYLAALLPQSLNRFLLYFFYRWETCVREATILGMLGISSLGFHIGIARDFFRYDRMLFFVLLGVAAVVALDLTSNIIRRTLRPSS